jgi:hypothetical protein
MAQSVAREGVFLAIEQGALHRTDTVLDFVVRSATGVLLEGSGVVARVIERALPGIPRGLCVRFVSLTSESRAFVERMVARHVTSSVYDRGITAIEPVAGPAPRHDAFAAGTLRLLVAEVKPTPVAQGKLPVSERAMALAVAADRAERAALLADPYLGPALGRAEPNLSGTAARRLHLRDSVRIAPSMAPDVFRTIDHARRVLDVDVDVELFTGEGVTSSIAEIYAPAGGVVAMQLSAFVLDHLDAAELAFVVGHELGHVALGHNAFNPCWLDGETRVPLHASARLFAWYRQAEISADRMGLLCCGDREAAIRAMFKTTTGLAHRKPPPVEELLVQPRDLVALAQGGGAYHDADWRRMHPYSPLRLSALDLFARSEAFRRALGQPGGELTDDVLEANVAALVAVMMPPPRTPSVQRAIDHFLIIAANSMFDEDDLVPAEKEALLRLISTLHATEVIEARAKGAEALNGVFAEAVAVLRRLAYPDRARILEDLASLALVHNGVSPREREVLENQVVNLRLDGQVLAAILERLQNPLG